MPAGSELDVVAATARTPACSLKTDMLVIDDSAPAPLTTADGHNLPAVLERRTEHASTVIIACRSRAGTN